MLKKNNRQQVLEIFFDNPMPSSGFQLREISRIINLAPLSVKKYLDEFVKEKLIRIEKHRVNDYPLYFANREENFKFYKKTNNIKKIYESGLLDHIYDKSLPDVIYLFGSYSLGEDLATSDIDLYVQSKEKKIDLKKFEKILKRKINIFFDDNFNNLSKNLRNNIINGIKLRGYLKIWN